MKALVSIIMPVFNAEQYVAEAVRSVLAQTYANWELLIVNDGSTDESRDRILEIYDDRIRYFEQKNEGTSAARNVGLANMRGDFFCFLDADDRMPKKSIASRMDIFAKDPKLGFVDGSVIYYNADFSSVLKKREASFKGNPIPELCRLNQQCFFGNTWMFKRREGVKYQFEKGLTHGEDLLFYLQYGTNGELAYTPEEVLYYRTGNNSAMSSIQGLENGYRFINQRLPWLPHISKFNRKVYRQKSRSVMVKSYLGKFRIFGALRVLLFW